MSEKFRISYKKIVRASYPNAFMKKEEIQETVYYPRATFKAKRVMFEVFLPNSQPWNGQVTRIGYGISALRAWKNAAIYIENRMLEKLERYD